MYLINKKNHSNSLPKISPIKSQKEIYSVFLLVKRDDKWIFQKDQNGHKLLQTPSEGNPRNSVKKLWKKIFGIENIYLQLVSTTEFENKISYVYMFNLSKKFHDRNFQMETSFPFGNEDCHNNRLEFLSVEEAKLSKLEREIFKEIIKTRRAKNSFFSFDNINSIGRVNTLSNGDEEISIKQGIADPIDISRTLVNLYDENKERISGPLQIDINPTTVCTDSCTFCFNKEDRERRYGTINLEKTIDALKHLLTHTNLMHVKISGFGDPLTYKNLWELTKFCRDNYLYTTINTNGLGLENSIDHILETVDSIRFSLDAASTELYKKIHGRNDLNFRKQSILKLVQKKREVQSELIVGIHYVVTPENYHELGTAAQWAKQNGLDYIDLSMEKFKKFHLKGWVDEETKNAINEINGLIDLIDQNFNVILPPNFTLYQNETEQFRKRRNNKRTCWHMKLRHYITPYGEYGSCNSYDSFLPRKRIFGNVHQERTPHILNNYEEKSWNKVDECYNCVVPFGILNDLTEWIFDSLEKGKSISYGHDSPPKKLV